MFSAICLFDHSTGSFLMQFPFRVPNYLILKDRLPSA